ncbi:hypothetical protein GN958_ATG20175 [Phytophthora infestans]|uniref:Uncharacterized protein n=1 Tax=Phytophthora infestans TaxID=4787 RepID=A0A8S9TRJ6_PHYIN|nr:hypothetical protein GN958_ATG20175 [Phytophthora infestans]
MDAENANLCKHNYAVDKETVQLDDEAVEAEVDEFGDIVVGSAQDDGEQPRQEHPGDVGGCRHGECRSSVCSRDLWI